MLAFVLALATSVNGLPLGELAPQALPASGCAAYLFTTGDKRHFVAVASAGSPSSVRW